MRRSLPRAHATSLLLSGLVILPFPLLATGCRWRIDLFDEVPGPSGPGGASPDDSASGGTLPTMNEPCKPLPQGPARDADDDGVIDAFDPDDDNDGLSDLAECFPQGARFLNASFELPVLSKSPTYYLDQNVPGWTTSDPNRQIEFWQDGFEEITVLDGTQLVEIARSGTDILTQSIPTIPGTTLRWAFRHRGRDGEDTVELSIGAPSAVEVQGEYTTGLEWAVYEGTYTVPAGQTVTRFDFHALFPDNGSGNLFDGADAEPICEIDTDGDGCVDSEDPD